MPVLRPLILPTVGTPTAVVAPSRRRGPTMANQRFYQAPPQAGGQYVNEVPTPSATQARGEERFQNESMTGQYLAEQMGKYQKRTPPPSLEPGARVKGSDMNLVGKGAFAGFYDRLNLITQSGEDQLAAAKARAAAQRIKNLNNTGSSPSSGGGGSPSNNAPFTGSGNVGGWIQQAANVLKGAGIHLSGQEMNWVSIMIQHESGGNPNAINLWDSNAKAGIPSKGLMQTIDPTFNSNKLPGYDNIYDPVANIIAGVRYAIRRYGSIGNVPGIRGINNGGRYVGY